VWIATHPNGVCRVILTEMVYGVVNQVFVMVLTLYCQLAFSLYLWFSLWQWISSKRIFRFSSTHSYEIIVTTMWLYSTFLYLCYPLFFIHLCLRIQIFWLQMKKVAFVQLLKKINWCFNLWHDKIKLSSDQSKRNVAQFLKTVWWTRKISIGKMTLLKESDFVMQRKTSLSNE
jgi:hypothetical protein